MLVKIFGAHNVTMDLLLQINFELKIKPPSAKSERMSSFVIICYLVLSIILQLMDIEYLVHSAYYDSKLCEYPLIVICL